MARAIHKLKSKIYSFGCKISPEARDVLIRHLRRGADYQNALVEIERKKAMEVDELRAEVFPEYGEAVRRVEQAEQHAKGAYDERARERQRIRKRSTPEELDQRIVNANSALQMERAALRAEREKVVQAHKAANDERKRRAKERRTINTHEMVRINAEILDTMLSEEWPETWKQEMRIYDQELRDAKRARANSRMGAANQIIAEDEVRAAKDKAGKEGGMVRFQRGISGRVAVDLGRGCGSTHSGYGCHHHNLKMVPLEPNSSSRRSMLRRKVWVMMRVSRGMVEEGGRRKQDGSDVIECWALLHRPIPDHIKQAWILANHDAGRWTFRLQFVVQGETLGDRAPAKRHDRVQVTLGNEQLLEGGDMRVGEWSGSDGSTGTVELDKRTMEALFERADEMQAAQDRHFNEAREVVRAWAFVQRMLGRQEPTLRISSRGETEEKTLTEAIRGCSRWRNPGRLCQVAKALLDAENVDRETMDLIWSAWKGNRLPQKLDLHARFPLARLDLAEVQRVVGVKLSAPQSMAVWLEMWRRKNEHLREYARNERETAQRRRAETYRVLASMLAGRYDKCEVIEPVSLKKRSRKQDGRGVLDRILTRRRRLVAGSILKDALKNAFVGIATKKVEEDK
jgi:hypothetical protein